MTLLKFRRATALRHYPTNIDQREVECQTGVRCPDHAGPVVGGLINNQWSFAGWGRQNVNALLFQPFCSGAPAAGG